MYLSRPYHLLGSSARADTIVHVQDDSEAIRKLRDSKVEFYNAIGINFGEATELVLSQLFVGETLSPTDVHAILYTRICDTNNEEFDRQIDVALTNLDLISTPLYQIGGGQCANGGMLLREAENILLRDENATVLIVEANIVDDTQKRNYLGNTVVLSDGVVAYTVSNTPNTYKRMCTSIAFDHKVRGLQYSNNPVGPLLAFKKTKQLLVECMSEITVTTSKTMHDFVKIFPSNSHAAVQQIRESFELDESKIYTSNISKHGHYFGAELFYNFMNFDHSGEWLKDEAVLLFHCGYSAFGFSAIQKTR